jgi:hypothetical protein
MWRPFTRFKGRQRPRLLQEFGNKSSGVAAQSGLTRTARDGGLTKPGNSHEKLGI